MSTNSRLSRAQLKNIVTLKHKKFRTQQGSFLIEGYRLCREALQSDFNVETLLINPDLLPPSKYDEIIQIAKNKTIEISEIQQQEVNKLSETVHSQGIFCIIKQHKIAVELLLQKDSKVIVIIDEGQDPGNIGTVIRTCDWFGIDAIVLGKGSVELFNPKLIRSTMGSLFHVPIINDIEIESLLPRLKQAGYHLFAADNQGDLLYHQVVYQIPLALTIGNENRGIRKSLYPHFDKIIKIPAYGKAESLNMAMATGIIISRIVNSLKC